MPKGLSQTCEKGEGQLSHYPAQSQEYGRLVGLHSRCFLKGQLPPPQVQHGLTDPPPQKNGPGDRHEGTWGNPFLLDTPRMSEAPLSPSVMALNGY